MFGVVDDVRGFVRFGEVISPETYFVEVAATVTILGAIEYGGSGMATEQVDMSFADDHRHIPMAFAGESENGGFRWRVPRWFVVCAVGHEIVWHGLPEQLVECSCGGGVQGESAVEGHCVLPGVLAVSEAIVGAIGLTVVIEVEVGGHAGVYLLEEDMRIAQRLASSLRGAEVAFMKQAGVELLGMVVVDFVDEEDVRSDSLDDFRCAA